MSWQSLADVFEYVQRTPDLSPYEVLVLLAIANRADASGGNAHPKQKTLRAITKLSRRSLQYTLRSLEHRGLLTTRVHRGRRGYTEYTLHLPHVLRKGATHAPFQNEKGAQIDQKKAQEMRLSSDPVQRTKYLSLSFPSSFAEGLEEKRRILQQLGITPDSPLYPLMLGATEDGVG